MVMPVGPMVDSIIGTDHVQCILVTLNIFLEIEELGHRVNLGMYLIDTVRRIHVLYETHKIPSQIILAGEVLLVYSFSSRIFIISTAALATEVPGPKIAATPAL